MNSIVQIDVSTLKERLQRGEALNMIDVREDEEVARGMIAGAKHIPMNQIPGRLHEIEQNGEIIFICRSGYRSERVCEYLQQIGIQGAVNMEGGMIAWSQLED
ncbi:rhodanese-like domain-containing protein [Paenibacillus apiarius]|uniref:Rhodanese-like domain-containing protein n=1 Tax=Paenibacillus apiarius TaxID=46240 RepID=A0ABT4DLG7_9BACL|nr:rhodanese-like domain-containing protein [Paenibacillus apiarius]MCY9513648.1 rhodanese-like domain-containing protein [Paenibacillus apiarius]MCY9518199.1 rhodanese-like domain-containing protein [Paenibacillus apiarius]MCY9551400.1 rhodanese-like domain-containing protein [Paenibacillus apiarius]MCY9558554.1 rhodanese-like domain-containing protein [Paenibacillus apiarius]MCY9684132.1 rhodanese-like domain-containing protein [Paenibacillus apiarius]